MTGTFCLASTSGKGVGRLEKANDQLLVHLTARGDARALEVLHKRYYVRLYKLAFVKLGNEEDAHDVASEALVKAVQNLSRLDPLSSASLYPWLHTVVVNLCVDVYRRRAHIQTISDAKDAIDLLSILERVEDDGPSPEEVVARKGVQRVVREALTRLPDAQAQAVYYRFIGELPLAEIGKIMNKSEGAIKSLLYRGILNLRALITATVKRGHRQLKTGRAIDVHRDTLPIHRRTVGGA